jgi:hypothetical protein
LFPTIDIWGTNKKELGREFRSEKKRIGGSLLFLLFKIEITHYFVVLSK